LKAELESRHSNNHTGEELHSGNYWFSFFEMFSMFILIFNLWHSK